ncbi:MAG: UvrB/UvrC motif-containing protein [Planctomycetaceae bacterium]|jgi:protein arginine kinase activator|nr:UvrB/UvrC motif-containing protein [Planctomycetaceae bacterium]
MKCQKCNHPATFHITELTGAKPAERHLCEKHAREYLSDSSQHGQQAGNLASALSEGIPKQVSANKAAAELKELDQQTCPVCGISFCDFRSTGRLGCPNDYAYFNKQIDLLMQNIHNSREHVGKRPHRFTGSVQQPAASPQTLLIKLRRDLDEAVQYEDYERAALLRDKIKKLEREQTKAACENGGGTV